MAMMMTDLDDKAHGHFDWKVLKWLLVKSILSGTGDFWADLPVLQRAPSDVIMLEGGQQLPKDQPVGMYCVC